jgi:hypothetical protein
MKDELAHGTSWAVMAAIGDYASARCQWSIMRPGLATIIVTETAKRCHLFEMYWFPFEVCDHVRLNATLRDIVLVSFISFVNFSKIYYACLMDRDLGFK